MNLHIYSVHVDAYANQKASLIAAAVSADGGIQETYYWASDPHYAGTQIQAAHPDQDLSSPVFDVPKGLKRNGWGSHSTFAEFFLRHPIGNDSVFILRQPLDPIDQEKVLRALRGEESK